MHPKLRDTHLARKAVVYVRQSTAAQVQGNLESQRRQYGLAQRARELGFADVLIIDEDLGRSASGTQARPGFEKLVTEVLGGQVGAVFCIEASRLARNGRDWHHLLDLCSLTDTMIVDPDGMYDPRHSNDRLLLGLKGSMSEFELTLLRQRAQEAMVQKAKRGELRMGLPVGLEWTRDGRIVFDPDLRVQQCLHLVFRKFTERGSIRQTLMWFGANQLPLPYLVRGMHPGERIKWKEATYGAMDSILKNPLYAGAYAWGRTENRTKIVDGRARKGVGHRKPQERWTVLIQEHHPGYISWPEYLRNQQVMRENAHRTHPQNRKAGRGGGALLSGMLRCRRCGRRLMVTYKGENGHKWSYLCFGDKGLAKTTRCLYLPGGKLDAWIGKELVRVLSPMAIEAAYVAAQTQQKAESELVHAVERELEEARYQAELEARRYREVDPANRLVAVELERRWEAALLRVGELERRLCVMHKESSPASEASLAELLSLAKDFPAVWNSPHADRKLRQRLVRLLLYEVLCDVDRDRREASLLLHWQGGRHSELRVSMRRQGQSERAATTIARQFLVENVDVLQPAELAAALNRQGERTGTGRRWTAASVCAYLSGQRLGKYGRPAAVTEGVCLAQAARILNISPTALLKLMARGLLQVTQRYAHSPYRIPESALHDPVLLAAVREIQQSPISLARKARKPTPRNPQVDEGRGA